MATDYSVTPSYFLYQDIESFSFDIRVWNQAKAYEHDQREGSKSSGAKKVKHDNVIKVERQRDQVLGW